MHVEGDSRAEFARGMRKEDRGGGGGARVDAARGGREDGARGVRRDTCLHGIPAGALARIRTNNGIKRINREIRRRTRVVGTFPNGNSALMLVTARLKYIVKHEWGKRRYLDMTKLEEMDELRGKAEG